MTHFVDELRLLIRSRHPIITIETDEEQRAAERVMHVAGTVSIRVFRWDLVSGLCAAPPAPPTPLPETHKPADVLARILSQSFPAVYIMMDLCPHLKDPVLQRMLRTFAEAGPDRNQTLVLLDHRTDVPQGLSRDVIPIEFALPDEAELEAIVRQTFKDLSRYSRIRHELNRDQFRQILQALRGLSAHEATRAVSRAILDDDCLNAEDIPRLLEVKREIVREAGLLEFIDIDIRAEDLAGLSRLKQWLAVRRDALSPEARSFGLQPPRGILLLGVQGCGKSLACKTVAAMWQMPLLKLDPGQFYDKFVGESERNLRKAIQLAESMAPVVLWIDEIEKAFASAAAHSVDGGLSQRMFGSLLTWLQDHREPIFVAATANDIQALPPELMRKGRFDEIFFVDLPNEDVRRQIFAVHLRRRRRDPALFNLTELAQASQGFSGAEIEQAIVAALFSAFRDRCELDTPRILAEITATRPLSTVMGERMADLRAWAEDRCVPADG